MAKTININHLLAQVEQLDDTSKLNLMERIITLIKKEKKGKKKIAITDLNGLGKEIWKGVSVDSYIEKERQW
jgi:hypothetical protein